MKSLFARIRRRWSVFPVRTRRVISVSGIVVATAATFIPLRLWMVANTPIYTTGAGIPDAAAVGGPDEAVRRTQRLLDKLRENGWDLDSIPKGEQLLPDRNLAEARQWHGDRIPSYYFTYRNQVNPVPEYAPVAFYSSIYVRNNISYYRGDRASSKPTGFYIVAWKDGRVTRVPIGDTRLIRSRNGSLVDVFPGCEGWTPDGFREPPVELADDWKGSKERRAAFERYTECTQGCGQQ